MILMFALIPQVVKSSCHLVSRPRLNNSFYESLSDVPNFCTNSNEDKKKVKSSGLKLPEEPQNCCMSGCANCVWVTYAEELAKILNDGGETAKQKIMEHVKDPNLRAFLMLELQDLLRKKK